MAREKRAKQLRADLAPSADADILKKDPDQSIVDAIEEIKEAEFLSREDLKKDVLGKTGMEYLKLISLFAIFSHAADAGKAVEDINAGINPAMVKAEIKNYPLLDKFDIFPGYLRILDNTLLAHVSKAYEKDVLKAADPTKSVSSIQDINDFIPEYLLEKYNIKIGKA
jgi:hypothetical protein